MSTSVWLYGGDSPRQRVYDVMHAEWRVEYQVTGSFECDMRFAVPQE